jgi:hypothetical protein
LTTAQGILQTPKELVKKSVSAPKPNLEEDVLLLEPKTKLSFRNQIPIPNVIECLNMFFRFGSLVGRHLISVKLDDCTSILKYMADTNPLEQKVYSVIGNLVQDGTVKIVATTPLIGDGSVLDSMKLVELCLLLEDMAAEMGFAFDWTSAAAMSKTRSIFRTAGALAGEFQAQKERKKT